MVHSI